MTLLLWNTRASVPDSVYQSLKLIKSCLRENCGNVKIILLPICIKCIYLLRSIMGRLSTRVWLLQMYNAHPSASFSLLDTVVTIHAYSGLNHVSKRLNWNVTHLHSKQQQQIYCSCFLALSSCQSGYQRRAFLFVRKISVSTAYK